MTIEERLDAMQAELDRLNCALRARTDREQIENLMGRYQYLHAAHMDRQILDELWSKDPDIHVEEGPYGVYLYDRNGIADFYTQRYHMNKPAQPGQLTLTSISTPVIEVAGDGKTAKGVWISFGTESSCYPDGTPSGIPSVDASEPDEYGNRVLAHWVWQKVAADFIREEGEWKIWHLHIYELQRCPFDQNWVTFAHKRFDDQAAFDSEMRLCMEGITPEEPTSFHWQYTPDATPVLQPVPPTPYESFDPRKAY